MANKDIQKEIRSLDDTAQFTLSTRQMAEYCQRIVAYLETKSAIGNRDIRCGSYREIQVFRPRLYLNQSMGIWGAISMI